MTSDWRQGGFETYEPPPAGGRLENSIWGAEEKKSRNPPGQRGVWEVERL